MKYMDKNLVMGFKKKNIKNSFVKRKGESKAVPLEAWSVPEGSRKLKFPEFMTTQDGG